MANLSAKRYVCNICGGEYIVTREGGGKLFCCGQPMTIKEFELSLNPAEVENAAQEGARYNCNICKTQILCIKAGNIPFCCGSTLEKKIARIDAVSE